MHNNWRMLNKVTRNGKAVGGQEPVNQWDTQELINEVAGKDIEDMALDSKKRL